MLKLTCPPLATAHKGVVGLVEHEQTVVCCTGFSKRDDFLCRHINAGRVVGHTKPGQARALPANLLHDRRAIDREVILGMGTPFDDPQPGKLGGIAIFAERRRHNTRQIAGMQ